MAADVRDTSPTDESLEKLFTVCKLEEGMVAGFEAGVKGSQAGMEMTNLSPDMLNKMAKGQAVMMDVIKEEISYEKIKIDLLNIYKNKYSQIEVLQIIKFFESEIGKKYATVQIELLPETQAVILPRIKAVMPRAMKLMMEEMGKP